MSGNLMEMIEALVREHYGTQGLEYLRQHTGRADYAGDQVVGRVHNDEGQGEAWLNSVGRKLPDGAALYAGARSAAAVLDGYAFVPVHPTKEMIDAGRWHEFAEESCHLFPVDDESVSGVWNAMLKAAICGAAKNES